MGGWAGHTAEQRGPCGGQEARGRAHVTVCVSVAKKRWMRMSSMGSSCECPAVAVEPREGTQLWDLLGQQNMSICRRNLAFPEWFRERLAVPRGHMGSPSPDTLPPTLFPSRSISPSHQFWGWTRSRDSRVPRTQAPVLQCGEGHSLIDKNACCLKAGRKSMQMVCPNTGVQGLGTHWGSQVRAG